MRDDLELDHLLELRTRYEAQLAEIEAKPQPVCDYCKGYKASLVRCLESLERVIEAAT
jgi:hypothetical protein